jgi:hypothetical protein
MVGDDVLVCHRLRPPVLLQWWDLFSCHGLIGHGVWGSRRNSFATRTSSSQRADHRVVISDIGSLVSFTRHGGAEDGEVQCTANESIKFWKHEWETIWLGMHNDVHLYMCGRRQCADTFPKEIILFFFNYPRDPVTGLRSQKGRKIKMFWSLQRPREETPDRWVNIYQSLSIRSAQLFAWSRKKELTHLLNIVWLDHSSNQSIGIIQYTTSDQVITLWDPVGVRLKGVTRSVQISVYHEPD